MRQKFTGPGCSGEEGSSPQMHENQSYLNFLERTERLRDSQRNRETELTRYWHVHSRGRRGAEGLKITFILIFPTIFLSFPLRPLPVSQCPPFQQNPSTFISFFIIPPFLSLISYPLALSPSLQMFVHISINSLSEKISRILDC